jgi:hypothetical protein
MRMSPVKSINVNFLILFNCDEQFVNCKKNKFKMNLFVKNFEIIKVTYTESYLRNIFQIIKIKRMQLIKM